MSYLLDTGFYFAMIDDSDADHAAVIASLPTIDGTIYLPTVVTTEVAYLVLRDMGREALADFVERLSRSQFVFVEPLAADYERAATILRKYADSNLDFVDVILFAIAERLNITRILTIDTRHFRMFRPNHTPAFELIP